MSGGKSNWNVLKDHLIQDLDNTYAHLALIDPTDDKESWNKYNELRIYITSTLKYMQALESKPVLRGDE